MKFFKLITLALFVTLISCASDKDKPAIEDGKNPVPNLQSVGSSANNFLSAAKYDAVVVEVLYVTGFQPTAQTLINLKQFMEARLNKPAGITIVEKQISSPGNSPYDNPEIIQIESNHRTKYNNGNVLALYIFFADGNAIGDSSNTFTLGRAYRNTSFVVFENSIKGLSDAIGEANRVDLETTVVEHELGHLLGLVNLGSTMQTEHLDEAHDKHCDNENCLMYWEAEGNGVMQMMLSGNIPVLDNNCLADLIANGGN
ncbi:MAG: membrane metalloprotease [Burkholderiales bacterium]|nr:membrane metalloprotease [Flavobacterium sp.]